MVLENESKLFISSYDSTTDDNGYVHVRYPRFCVSKYPHLYYVIYYIHKYINFSIHHTLWYVKTCSEA